MRYVLENGPDVDPLSPENILCFLNGPLTGSETSMSGRWAAVTKSPLTGTVTDSHQGGWTGRAAALGGPRRADLLRQVPTRPVYAFVEDGADRAARRLGDLGQGHATTRCDHLQRERYGEKDLSVCAIGPGR